MAARDHIARANVLGVGISAINRHLAVDLVLQAVQQKRQGYVCVTGVHGVMESYYDPSLRTIHNQAFLVTPDGMPMVWMGKLQGHRQMGRVYGPDLMLDVCQVSARHGLRHYFYGGAPGVAEAMRDRLCQRFPGLEVVGIYSPPFRPLNLKEEEALQADVKEKRPQLLWVGLSTPKQERFMSEYLGKLDVTLMLGVGAAFDFHAGRVRQAPHWMQQSGLEWFYRVTQEPSRLWRRYLRNNPRFIALAFCQLTGLRRFPPPG